VTAQDKADEQPDLLLVYGPAPDGRGQSVIRRRNNRLEAGSLMPLVHGRPIEGEVVALKPRPEHPRLFEVKTEWAAEVRETPERAQSGPVRVTNERYRDGWKSIWGATDRKPDADLN